MTTLALTLKELTEKLDAVVREKDNLQVQLNHAKRNFAMGGRSSDPDWLSKMELRIKTLGREHQRLLLLRSETARAERRAYGAARDGSPFDTAFKDMAKKMLTGEQYDAIIKATLATLQPSQP